MRIRHLSLRPFRNFAALQIPFTADHSLVTAGNGSGKTNLLEAISYLSLGKSVRRARDAEAVPHGGEYFDISGDCEDDHAGRQLRLFCSRSEGKTAFCDGAPLPRLVDLVGRFRTVHFSPQDVGVVLRSPAERRRLLDVLLSQSSPAYLQSLLAYQHALAQRNRLLRDRRGAGVPAGGWPEIDPWTEQLGRHGAALRCARNQLVTRIDQDLAALYRHLSGGRETLAIAYHQGAAALPGDPVAALVAHISSRLAQDVHLGWTSTGPHRDDVQFTLDGQPADTYASAGQLKSALVAWKLAEMRYLETPPGNQPVLLLDDALAELDERRAAALLELIAGFAQVILTSPLPLALAAHAHFAPVALPH